MRARHGPPDLPKGHGAGPVAVGLLDSSGRGRRLAGSLGGQLLPGDGKNRRGFKTARLTKPESRWNRYLGALPPVDLRAVCLVRAIVVVVLMWCCCSMY